MTTKTISQYRKIEAFTKTPLYSAMLTLAGLSNGAGNYNLIQDLYAEQPMPEKLGDIARDMLSARLTDLLELKENR